MSAPGTFGAGTFGGGTFGNLAGVLTAPDRSVPVELLVASSQPRIVTSCFARRALAVVAVIPHLTSKATESVHLDLRADAEAI